MIYTGTDFKKIARHPNLPIDFIETYFYKLRPFCIESIQKLPTWFIIKYQNALNWKIMSGSQELTEELIELRYKYVNWALISGTQKLSKKFICKWSNFIDWNRLLYNRHIPVSVMTEVKPLFEKKK